MTKSKTIILTITILLLAVSPAAAKLDPSQFAKIIILDQGRLKPMDSYARSLLIRFSGRSKIKGTKAIEWLAQSIFKPEAVYDNKIFLINNPEVVEAIGIEPDSHRRYSFNQIQAASDSLHEFVVDAYAKEEQLRSKLETELIRIFMNFHSYIKVINSLQIYYPHPDFKIENQETLKLLGLKNKDSALFDILSRSKDLQAVMETIDVSKLDSLPAAKQEVVKLSVNLYRWIENQREYQETFNEGEELYLIPTSSERQKHNTWLSPWQLLLRRQIINNKQELQYLNKIYRAYREDNQKIFDDNIIKLKQRTKQKIKNSDEKIPKINLEIFYNRLNPFTNAKFLYGFAFLLSMIASFFLKNSSSKSSYILLLTGFTIHSIGIICRILILERPPVSNLYETFIFVSWIITLLGIILSSIDKKSNLGLILASLSGLILLLISGKFADGDTLQVLIAVLNSNFWLSTHVICITTGYAGVFAAGVVGHIYLIKRMFGNRSNNEIKVIYGILAFGLCFSFLGTMLGGIWADQSWGRFWGWDPKENGALLIVIWTAIIFHARMAGLIHQTGLAVCSVIGCMVVMTSWFGINLLGVGLHSYGFTEGLAAKLYLYYAAEIIFIITSLLISQKQIDVKT